MSDELPAVAPGERAGLVELRWPCPVCLGSRMQKVRVQEERTVLTLDACPRCGGLWFERGEVRRLARREPTVLATLVAAHAHHVHPPCHGCRAPLGRDADTCAVCGRRNLLPCPMCNRAMQRRAHAGITLDFCTHCHGVWFDNAELSHIWRMAAALRVDLAGTDRSSGSHAVSATGDGLLEVALWAPDLAVHGSVAVIQLVADVAVTTGEAIGGAAESVFSVVLEIVVAAFEGL